MWIIGLLIGLIVGGLIDRGDGAVFGAVLGAIAGLTMSLRKRTDIIDQLQERDLIAAVGAEAGRAGGPCCPGRKSKLPAVSRRGSFTNSFMKHTGRSFTDWGWPGFAT